MEVPENFEGNETTDVGYMYRAIPALGRNTVSSTFRRSTYEAAGRTSRSYATMSVSICLSVCLCRKCIGAL